MTARILISLVAGASVVLTVAAGCLLWWLSNARTSTKGWVGNAMQIAEERTYRRKRGRLRKLVAKLVRKEHP